MPGWCLPGRPGPWMSVSLSLHRIGSAPFELPCQPWTRVLLPLSDLSRGCSWPGFLRAGSCRPMWPHAWSNALIAEGGTARAAVCCARLRPLPAKLQRLDITRPKKLVVRVPVVVRVVAEPRGRRRVLEAQLFVVRRSVCTGGSAAPAIGALPAVTGHIFHLQLIPTQPRGLASDLPYLKAIFLSQHARLCLKKAAPACSRRPFRPRSRGPRSVLRWGPYLGRLVAMNENWAAGAMGACRGAFASAATGARRGGDSPRRTAGPYAGRRRRRARLPLVRRQRRGRQARAGCALGSTGRRPVQSIATSGSRFGFCAGRRPPCRLEPRRFRAAAEPRAPPRGVRHR